VNGPSDIGRQLYALLPAVYRSRDNSVRGADGTVQSPGDLMRYLDACGELLDALKATLDQRLADAFPDNPPADERACQDWILPYFADLLDARLVSPEVAGRRNEIANAVAWRQRKGTLSVVEAVTESVGRMEAEVQEGWRRVALTARIGMPLLPATAYGEVSDARFAAPPPARRAKHPGLPAVTPDLRLASRAVRTAPGNAAARTTRHGAETVTWRQVNPHGVPCFPGSYEDVSKRTVDLRTPDWRRGHAHPRRLLLHVPPPDGFFAADQVRLTWAARTQPANAGIIEVETFERRGGTASGIGVEQVHVIRGLTATPPCITDPVVLAAEGADQVFRFEHLCLDGGIELEGGRLELHDCAARDVRIVDVDGARRLLDARNTLFQSLAVDGLARLEYCTVLATAAAATLQASDCIFVGPMEARVTSPPSDAGSCIRYSRLPDGANDFEGDGYAPTCTAARPVFHTGVFGQRGCGVLHPAAPRALLAGAEDGGELGAFHDRHHALRWSAVHDKLQDFLPVGREEVLIPDPRLLAPPPSLLEG
jgi:hypothetical protein